MAPVPGFKVSAVTPENPPEVLVKIEARFFEPVRPPSVRDVTVVLRPLVASPVMLFTVSSALFRIASLSKPITAAAVLRLVEQNRLSLDAKAFALLSDLKPLVGATVDPRLADITVRHLLQHAGGWDRDASFDPMFRSTEIAAATNTPVPASAEAVIRFMHGPRLDFDPVPHQIPKILR